ncbi:hypothetical protein [Solimonas soli]|uniref:hypothetical protein n=1 Tax=Solimonas soli TaxID=413479 RepID=UPI0004AD11BA|nr:hypothetical protein [Solimonas soli]
MANRCAIATAVLLSLALGAAQAQTGKRVQCWTDSKGQRACGDAVPPQYAQQQRELFDEQGRVRQVRPREKTAAEVAAEEKAEREKAEAALQAQKQRDYDRFLLESYGSARDIERARDERLNMIDGRRKLIEKQLADNDKAIAQQQTRIDNAGKDGKKPPAPLLQKLDELKQTRAANEKSLAEISDEKQKTADRYGADLARFRQLSGETAKTPPPAGAPPKP